jgi:acyl-CoA dehydrogenase
MALDDVLRWFLAPGPAVSHASVADFWAFHRQVSGRFDVPVDRAMVSAVRADRLGFAFAAGYFEALRALVPDLRADRPASFAVTEAGPPRPRNIHTVLSPKGSGFVLSGRKSWVTLGPAGGTLLVLARADASGNSDAERPQLRVVRVDASAPGITLRPTPPPPFTPEIEHAEVILEDVAIAPNAVLPGDGWDDYAKPFRTVEDLHVHAAVLAFVAGVAARSAWPLGLRERLLAAIVTTRALAVASPRAPEIHVAAAGLFATVTALFADCEPAWESAENELRERYLRDRAILAIASRARGERLERAWQSLLPKVAISGQSS